MLLANVQRYIGDPQKKRTSATPVIIPGVPSVTGPNLQSAHTLLPTGRGNPWVAARWGSNGSSRSIIGRTLAPTGRGTSVLTAGWIFGVCAQDWLNLAPTGGGTSALTAGWTSSRSARSRIGSTLALTGPGTSRLTVESDLERFCTLEDWLNFERQPAEALRAHSRQAFERFCRPGSELDANRRRRSVLS
jgi:hypothetical protein